jgi:23S rRNA (guanosine2251-2'-O)-methyltransferase
MKRKFIVIIHNLRSAYNVGSIFRTADGIGVEKIYLTGYTPAPNSRGPYSTASDRMIVKTALGAEKNVPFEKKKSIGLVMKKLHSEGFKIIALEQTVDSLDYTKFNPVFPLALIVGNEPKGLDRKITKLCDTTIEIPMRGKKESLNVAVAFGIAGYEIAKKLG